MDNFTTLILGAGVNKEINPGFYLGNDLIIGIRDRVTDKTTPKGKYFSDLLPKVGFDEKIRNDFVSALERYMEPESRPSIDDFIFKLEYQNLDAKVKSDYEKIAKIGTLFHILGCEGEIQNIDSKDNWFCELAYFLEKNDFPEKFKIITFNYDRVLEKYLLNFFNNSTNSIKFVNENIQHVYGRLGHFGNLYCKGNEVMVEYALENNKIDHIASSINNIKLIYEERNIDPIIKESILKSKKILIMGFGFDNTNNERIGLNLSIADKKVATYSESERQRILKIELNKIEIEVKNCTEFIKKELSTS